MTLEYQNPEVELWKRRANIWKAAAIGIAVGLSAVIALICWLWTHPLFMLNRF